MSLKTKIVIYWSRRDFRLTDNAGLSEALSYATENNLELIPLYILDNGLLEDNTLNIGSVRRTFLSKALPKFAGNFNDFFLYRGDYRVVFQELSNHFEIKLFVNEDLEPYSMLRDKFVEDLIGADNFNIYKDQLTVYREIRAGSGNLYSVFTPFKNAVIQEFLDTKIYPEINVLELKKITTVSEVTKNQLAKCENQIKAEESIIDKLIDCPNILHYGENQTIDIDQIHPRFDIDSIWYSDEKGAQGVWEQFLKNKILNYKEGRDGLGMDTLGAGQTSKMSVALKWGLVSARYLKQTIVDKFGSLEVISNPNLYHFISELIWREFYRYILYHRPSVLNLEYQVKFQNTIKWELGRIAEERFLAWIKGETGYKVVDAAMNQLAQTGWMHNRSRMIVASILTKNLGIDWRWGQEYFRLMLLDLDEASNNGGWQWGSSTGSDPKPIRIFNPYLQTENYDKENLYQNKWLPRGYKHSKPPIIDHKVAREQALARYNLDSYKITPRDY